MRTAFRRIEWRPWNWSTRRWFLTIVVIFVAAPFVTRSFCLWQVPDVTLPFDIDEFVGPEIPNSENAFRGYEAAARLLGKYDAPWLDGALDHALHPVDHAHWDDRLEGWLLDHDDLLAQFQRASHMNRSRAESWRTASTLSRIPLHQDLPKLVKIAQCEALRCEKEGDLERAWQWHWAVIRCGGHVEKNGYPVATGIGRGFRFRAYTGIAYWARDSRLTADRLRSARRELATEASTRMKLSDVLKVDYLLTKNAFDQFDAVTIIYPDWYTPPAYEPWASSAKQWFLWSTAQREVSLRLARQVLVNQVEQIDTPTDQRPQPTRVEYPMLFSPSSMVQRRPGQRTSSQLARILNQPFGKHLINVEFFSYVGPRKALPYDLNSGPRFDRTYAAMIDVVLASHEYERIHGQFPADIDALVPEFLDNVPIDEFSDTRAPLKYCRDDDGEAVVWSVGFNGTDEGGDIDNPSPKKEANDRGFRILKR